jgi:predicted ArsR family transcriptional regulator
LSEPPIHNLISALKSVLRRQLLRCLIESDEPRSPVRLAEQMGLKLSTVGYHMHVLKDSGVAVLVGWRPVRGATEHFYETVVADNPIVKSILAETRESDEREMPRNP